MSKIGHNTLFLASFKCILFVGGCFWAFWAILKKLVLQLTMDDESNDCVDYQTRVAAAAVLMVNLASSTPIPRFPILDEVWSSNII